MSCGGQFKEYEAYDDNTDVTDRCFEFDMDTLSWSEGEPMTTTKWTHTMLLVEGDGGANADMTAMSIGGIRDQTEIYDLQDGTWSRYVGLDASPKPVPGEYVHAFSITQNARLYR